MYVFYIIEFRLSGPLDIMELRHSKLCSRIDFSNPGDLGIIESPISLAPLISESLDIISIISIRYSESILQSFWTSLQQIFSMSSAELHSEFLPACGSNFCSKVTPKRPSRSNTLFPHQPRSVRLQGEFRSQIPPSSQPEKNVVRKPPSCTMHRALRSVPASSESNAAQNNEELRRSAAAVASQGGVYPPLEPIRAVAAGGGRPPPGL